MKLRAFALLLTLTLGLLTACYSPGFVRLSTDALTGTKRIVVVPIEPSPLTLSPRLSTPSILTHGLTYVPDPSIQAGARVVGVISGIVMLLKLPEATRRQAKAAEELQSVLSQHQTWIASAVVSHKAADLIGASSPHDVVLAESVHRLSSRRDVRGRDLVDWYNHKLPRTYEEAEYINTDYVLEVGVESLLEPRSMLIQVLMKLIDPATGELVGKARSFTTSRTRSVEELFANEAREFKELFASTARKLAARNLSKLRILSK